MSNYINVLRRLEREKRVPEPTPAPVTPAPVMPAPVAPAPQIVSRVSEAPVVTPTVAAPEPMTVAVRENTAPAARTIIPLPTASPTPIAPPPVAAVAPRELVAEPVVQAPAVQTPAVSHDTRRSRAFATEAHPGIATLLESIRLIANGRERRVVVFCGASTAEAVTTLAQDLAQYAERSGMTAFVGSLFRSAAGTIVAAANDPATAQSVDLDAGLTADSFATWIDRVAPNSNLVIVTGPPLATSIDAALLACACDGLVIVAESEVTERATLQVAAERARIAGCTTLGVVMHGSKDRLPGWIRRIIGEPAERH